MYIRLFSRVYDLVHTWFSGGVPVRDVLADRAVEENRFLLHEADRLASVGEPQLGEGYAVLGLEIRILIKYWEVQVYLLTTSAVLLTSSNRNTNDQ